MTHASTAFPTLAETLAMAATRKAPALPQKAAIVLLGTLLLTLSAKIQIPFWPVPLTMQTAVVLMLGMALGWRLATVTLLAYFVEGALGLPVFAGTPERGLGLAYMLGPTGGYLAGFLVAAALCGVLAERGWDRSIARTALAVSLGHLLILGAGFAWLAFLMPVQKAYAVGVAPFYAATVLKTLLVVVALPGAWKALKARRPR
jgi:biotin transport system substrate-specific component